jgi:hypothetical protein
MGKADDTDSQFLIDLYKKRSINMGTKNAASKIL